MDKDGNPVTRIRTVELFKDIGRKFSDWSKLLEEVNLRAGRFGLDGHPFAIAPIRRLQPGYKWQHQFSLTPSGLITAFDERGVNSQRVAHMVPYIYNVLTTPMANLLKTARMLLPGAYHDGPAKTRRHARLNNMSKQGKLFLAEADYSNFDRFIAVDMVREIISMFTDLVPSKDYWTRAMMYLHDDASLLWPDFSSIEEGIGWAFKPGSLALLSGVKVTAETGTLLNSVVNGEALARTYGWNESQLFDYLVQYTSSDVGSKPEYYYVQSDDTQLIASSLKSLINHGNEFEKAITAAGLKGSHAIADRFLMRHLQNGADRPVPARVWQNTLSNESPPEHELIFLAGLAARTDGLFGCKTVDPFNTAYVQSITEVELEFTYEMLLTLRKFIKKATDSSITAVRLLDAIMSVAPSIRKEKINILGTFKADTRIKKEQDNIRRGIIKALALEELNNQKTNSQKAIENWLKGLYRDRAAPSSAMILEQLGSQDPSVISTVTQAIAKEEAFFKYAASRLGVVQLTLNT
jgi:hypothetical protein